MNRQSVRPMLDTSIFADFNISGSWHFVETRRGGALTAIELVVSRRIPLIGSRDQVVPRAWEFPYPVGSDPFQAPQEECLCGSLLACPV